MDFNFEKLPIADPCSITDEWIFIENDRIYAIDKVKKDEHNFPRSVFSENYNPSIEYLMQNTLSMQPNIESSYERKRERGEELSGWRPVELRWKLNPDVMRIILAHERHGEWIGIVSYSHTVENRCP